MAQRKATDQPDTASGRPRNAPRKQAAAAKPEKSGLSYTQTHRLKELPGLIERLEAEIAKLEGFLSDPDLFTAAPAKFAKASDALVERHQALAAAEEEWLALEEKSETS